MSDMNNFPEMPDMPEFPAVDGSAELANLAYQAMVADILQNDPIGMQARGLSDKGQAAIAADLLSKQAGSN